jgi:uncharacterized repeat protein (TIGR01451 family)
MNNQKKCFKASQILFLLVLVVLLSVITGTLQAKSLYVLSDIDASPNPLQVYDIAANGTLTFQAQYSLPRYNLGSVGIAMDSDSGYLFVTYVFWNHIVIVNSKTMVTKPEWADAPGSYNLAGIVYNHKKSQLYCVDRGNGFVWVYDWNPKTVTLTLVNGAPFTLRNATAFGIAIDEVNQLLYVANSTNRIYAYSTTDWSLVHTVTLNRNVVSVAVDAKNNYVYAGGGYIGNPYLTQYDLLNNTKRETLVEPNAEAGVMGISVDPNSSYVYFTTGNEYLSGGDNIRIYDKNLAPVSMVHINGNPTGLVIPSKEVGYNPLGLEKTVYKILDGSTLAETNTVNGGDLVTYRICFGNNDNTKSITNVSVIDNLPDNVSFVAAADDGEFGEYNPLTHSYTWTYPTLVKGSTACLDITVKIKEDVLPMTSIVNTVTIKSDSTPPVTRRAEVVTSSRPLNIKKTVFGAISGQTKWVDMNEVITYNIYIDNKNNNFAANNVNVTDTLPSDLIFIKADSTFPGNYDKDLHAYTWTIPQFTANDSADLGITVRLKSDVPEGTIITNTATVKSGETAISKSTVPIRVGEGPLEVQNVQVKPSNTIRRDSNISGIMFILEMPSGYKITDINKNIPLLLSVVGDSNGISVPANNDQLVVQSLGKTYVVAVFNKKLVMDAIEGYGPKEIQIEGTLTNSGLFIGHTTINITKFAGS